MDTQAQQIVNALIFAACGAVIGYWVAVGSSLNITRVSPCSAEAEGANQRADAEPPYTRLKEFAFAGGSEG